MLSTPIRLGPFELHGRVGKGGMGEVWKGVHLREGVPVAVKLLLHAKGQNANATEAFEHEVRQVAMLDHPNVVLVLDYGQVSAEAAEQSDGRITEGSDYLVMEYASSGSLDAALQELSWKDVREILLSVLDALAYTHAHGVLHRDIKPGNVLVAGASDLRPGVKLADFGIAHAMAEGPQQKNRAGTPAYMAPEQIRGSWRDFGPWTDLYAVGCLAFRLITGAPPFQAPDAGRVMRAHLSSPVPALFPRMDVPEGIEGWILTLLQKSPRDRYAFAADAAAGLRKVGGRASPADAPRRSASSVPTQPEATFAWDTRDDASPSNPTLNPLPDVDHGLDASDPQPLPLSPAPIPAHWRGGAGAQPPPPRLVGAGLGLYGLRTVPLAGRLGERDRMWQRLRQAHRTQTPRAVVLQGPSGFGKSRLAGWISRRAHEVGAARVLDTVHDPLPGANRGLARLVSQHLRCGGQSASEMTVRVRQLLGEVGAPDDYEITTLVRLMAEGALGEGEPVLQPTERTALVARLLRRAASDRPVVVVLDDVQWGLESLQLVKFVLDNRATFPIPVLFVLTVRSEALALRPEESALLDALAGMDGVDVLPVGPLEPSDQSLLVQALLGLEPRVAELVERRTAGNPLFAIQLVGDWVRRGVLEVADAGFVLRAGERAELPDDVFAVWEARIDQLLADLPEGARAALAVAATLGREVDADEWYDACRHAGIEVGDELLPALFRLRFAERRPEGWSFVHAMLRESVERMARAAGSWPALNRACAATLAPRPSRGVQERVGRHLVEAGDRVEAVEPLLKGALERLAGSAYRPTRELLDLLDETLDAIGAAPDTRPRAESALARVRVHIGEGDFASAEALAARTAEGARKARDKGVQGRALRYRGMVAVKRGDLSVAEAMLLQAQVFATQAGLRDEVARATYHYGELLRIRGDLDGALDQFTDALGVFTEIDDFHGCADCEVALANTHDRNGDGAAGETHRRAALALFERIGNQFGIGSCWNTLGDHLRHRADHAGAEAAYRESLVWFDRIGAQARMTPIGNLGLLLLTVGRFDEARDRLETLLSLAEQNRRKVLAAYAHVGLLSCVARVRDWGGWDRHFDAAHALLEESGAVDRDFAEYLETASRAAAGGDAHRAGDAARLAASQWRQLGETDRALALEAPAQPGA